MSEQVTTQPEGAMKSRLADIVAGDTVINVKSSMTACTYQLLTVRRVTKTQIILNEGRREIRCRRADGTCMDGRGSIMAPLQVHDRATGKTNLEHVKEVMARQDEARQRSRYYNMITDALSQGRPLDELKRIAEILGLVAPS